MTEEQKQKAISLQEKAKEYADSTPPFIPTPTILKGIKVAAYLAGASEAERLRKENENLREQVRQLNAGMIHFSTLDRMPTLDLLSREGIIEHVVNIGKKKVLNNL